MQSLKTIISILVVCVSFHACAKQMYREKTYVALGSSESNRAMLWSNLMQQMDMISKNHVGSRIQIRASSYSTDKDVDFSQYFGVYNPARNAIESFVGIDQNDANEPLSSMNFIHDYARASSVYPGYGLRDRVSFKPEKRAKAFAIDIVQGFDKLFEGLSFRLTIPYVIARTSMSPKTLLADSHGMNMPGVGTHVTTIEYLAGNVANTDAGNKQEALKKLKITKDEHERKGISDIEIALRARVWEHGGSHLDAGLKMIAPSKHTPTGEYLFEATIGNGGHYGWGVDAVLDFLAFEHNDASVECVVHADYTYLFPANEIRVPLFNDTQGNLLAFGAYQLGGRVGEKGMFPLANALACPYKISPGHKIEGSVSCMYSLQGLVCELGASVTASSKEKVEIVAWNDDEVGLVKWDYDAHSAVSTANLWSTAGVDIDGVAFNSATNARTINKKSLNLESIATPSSMLATLFGFVGYSYAGWKYPASFGVGIMREVSLASNASPAGWNFWLKAGVNF